MTAVTSTSTTASAAGWHARAVRVVSVILALGVLVSVIHYVDNYVNYDDFPQPTSGPNPPRWLIPVSWVVFTAAGLTGYLMFRRRASTLALTLLAFYSVSGLIGIGHFTVPGAFDMPAARQAHVGADILCGVAMLGFVLWAAQTRPGVPPDDR
jgi:tryptophan-rich sensory protein